PTAPTLPPRVRRPVRHPSRRPIRSSSRARTSPSRCSYACAWASLISTLMPTRYGTDMIFTISLVDTNLRHRWVRASNMSSAVVLRRAGRADGEGDRLEALRVDVDLDFGDPVLFADHLGAHLEPHHDPVADVDVGAAFPETLP